MTELADRVFQLMREGMGKKAATVQATKEQGKDVAEPEDKVELPPCAVPSPRTGERLRPD